MKNTSLTLAIIANLLLLSGCSSCNSPSPYPEPDPYAGAAPIQLCERNCEKAPEEKAARPNWQQLKLNPKESVSLSHAVPAGKEAQAPTHLHASVVDGNLVFSSDSEPTHGTAATTIAVPAHGSEPAMQLKVIASPEAAALLHKRMG